MFEFQWICAYLVLGIFVGFFAGFLGLGGGAIMVPVLTSLFLIQGFPVESVVQIALATSMSVIMFSSYASLRAHSVKYPVIWPIFWKMLPGVFVGALSFTCIISYFSMQFLGILFSICLVMIACQMYFNLFPRKRKQTPGPIGLAAAGMSIGSVSALLSVGGGSLGMPYLTWCRVKAKKAVATSAALGFSIAVIASIGYLIGSAATSNLPENTIGYIYWPATLIISASSFLMAPVGAAYTRQFKSKTIKKIFAGLLFLFSGEMLLTAVF